MNSCSELSVTRLRDITYRCVGKAAECALHLGQVRAGDNGGRLMVNANLEPRGTPKKIKSYYRADHVKDRIHRN